MCRLWVDMDSLRIHYGFITDHILLSTSFLICLVKRIVIKINLYIEKEMSRKMSRNPGSKLWVEKAYTYYAYNLSLKL
jgi:hypothetical protein